MTQIDDFDDGFDTGDVSNITQAQLDFFSSALVIPMGKLDADQYAAEDLDGVTESLFGSGNMNFLSLQSSQTNDVISASDPFSILGSDSFASGLNGLNSGKSSTDLLGNFDSDSGADNNAGSGATNFDRSLGQNNELSGAQSNASDANFASATVGSLSASAQAANGGGLGLNGAAANGSGIDGSSGADGSNGLNGQSPEAPPPIPGPPGQPGQNGQNGGDDACHNGGININIDLGDTLTFVDNTITNLGDTITTLTTSLTEITDILNTVLQNLKIIDILDLTEIINTVNNLTQNLTGNVTNLLTEVTNVTHNVTNLLDGLLGGGHGDGGLNINILDIVKLGLDTSKPDLDLDISLKPVKHLTGDILDKLTDLKGLDFLGDALGDLGGAQNILKSKVAFALDIVEDLGDGILGEKAEIIDQLADALGNLDSVASVVTDVVDDAIGGLLDGLGLGGDGTAGDGDMGLALDIPALDALGLDIPDIQIDQLLNPVEDLVGDLDIAAGLGLDLLGQNGNEIDNANGDSDLNLGLDLDLLGTDLLGDQLEIPLDPVEAIIGDIDLDLGVATNLLGDLADGLVNNAEGGTAGDGLLADIGDGLGGLTDGILPGLNGDDTGNNDLVLDTEIEVLDQVLGQNDLGSVLDPVEEVVGDIDVLADLGLDLLGQSGNETDNISGDSDLEIDLDLDIAGLELPDIDLDIPLDPLEGILGDIDLEIGGALDLLNSDPAENTGGDGGLLSDITNWTESTIQDGGGLFGDIISGIGGESDALPEPVSSVAEGLGALNIVPEVVIGKLGGLFG